MTLLVFVVAVGATAATVTDISTRPVYVPNQLLVRFAPGITDVDRNTAIDELGGTIVRSISLANTYLAELNPSRGATVETAISRASFVPNIVKVEPNYYCYDEAIPNDPMWSQLWGMRMINAPQAWDIEKGSANVIVAVIDSGVSRTHPDLQGRLLPGYDVWSNDADPSPSPTYPNAGHGTHCAGIIAAQGNNGIGVVGVCWNGVRILPIKRSGDSELELGTTAETVEALEYAKQQGAQVVSMSFGSERDPNTFEHDKIKELYAAGIILVASAGNASTNAPHYPSDYEEIISVSAVGPTEALASYSNFGINVDIAAPGGDSPETIWSTIWNTDTGDDYAGWQGTSMACPHVAGAAALLISAGVPPSRVTGMLYRGARAPVTGVLDPLKYGHGILDLSGAVTSDSASISFVEPPDAAVLDTTTPSFKISTYLINKESIKIYLDYPDANRDGVPDNPSEDIILDGTQIDFDPAVDWNPIDGTLSFTWPVNGKPVLSPGTHTVCATAEPKSSAAANFVKDWMVFFVQPHIVPAGRNLFSVPYPLSADVTPYQLFGNTNFRLARFIPARNDYAKINYPGEIDDILAWPPDPGVHPHGDTIDTPPAGLGFWVELTADTPVVVDGVSDTTRSYDITLTRGVTGWNMIGDPFPFPVPWESAKVTYQGKTLTMNDAIAAEWLRPSLYRYTKSGYTFLNPPDAVLVPWEGHWIRILPNKPNNVNDTMILTIPPLESGAIVETKKSRLAATDGAWSFRLKAQTGTAADSYNMIGVNTRASEGYDLLDVEKPPMIGEYVQLAFIHNDWGAGSGRYAADFRPSIGTGKVWEFEVATDLANADVSVTWPDIVSVPKDYNLVLKDVDGGNSVYMRTRSSYVYNSGTKPGTRRFKLQVEPANSGNRLLVTNVAVSQTKGSGVSISYTISRDAQVEVRMRDNLNRVVRTLGGNTTRAAGINTVHWDSTFNDGRQVPVGLYLAEIVAIGPDGEVAKTVRPVVIGR